MSNPKRKPSRMRKHRIFVVDDHPLVCEGLTQVIDKEFDLTVCGQADNAAAAMDAIASDPPDLILLDLCMKGQSGLILLEDLRNYHPELPVLVLSMYDENLYGLRTLHAGARGYIMKQEPAEKVIEGIRTVLAGRFFFSSDLNQNLLESIARGNSTREESVMATKLTNRELQVLELIGDGHSTTVIARRLHLSPKTIETHKLNIRKRLNLPDSTALMHYAIRWLDTSRLVEE